MFVFEAELESVVPDVGGTGRRHAELALVELAEAVALGAVVVPEAIGGRSALSVEEGVVLDGQEVVVRPVEEGVVRGAVKQVEVLLRDRGELRVEGGGVEVERGVFPTDVAEDVRTRVVLVAVLLVDCLLYTSPSPRDRG